jgi:hypothetical protein
VNTEIITKEDLGGGQSGYYAFRIDDYDYRKYVHIVKLHNKLSDDIPNPGDIMICKSLDGKKVYNRGHIESGQLDDFSSICTGPSTPFVVNGGIFHTWKYPREFKTETSGGYWFSVNGEPVFHRGFRSKRFITWGHMGRCASGAFCFQLMVNVWEVSSKAIY